MVLALALAAAPVAPPPPPQESCTCLTDSVCNGWCAACGVGYVASVQIRSKQLFEALDAHGHEIDPGSFTCTSCRAAIASDGFCESCHRGFVGAMLHYSRLSYFLARGEPRDRTSLTCGDCLRHSLCRSLPLEKERWCRRCGIGMVGNVAFRDRKDFEAASRELEVLLHAVKESARCEDCAVAMFYGATCHRCRISYAGGVAQRVTPSP
jgi:hypothetical protein